MTKTFVSFFFSGQELCGRAQQAVYRSLVVIGVPIKDFKRKLDNLLM